MKIQQSTPKHLPETFFNNAARVQQQAQSSQQTQADSLRFGSAERQRFATQQASASGTLRPWQRLGDKDLLSPVYTDSVQYERDALQQTLLTATLSADASAAYDAMVAALQGLLDNGPSKRSNVGASLVSPAFSQAVQAQVDRIEGFVSRAMLSPDASKAYADILAALNGVVTNA